MPYYSPSYDIPRDFGLFCSADRDEQAFRMAVFSWGRKVCPSVAALFVFLESPKCVWVLYKGCNWTIAELLQRALHSSIHAAILNIDGSS